MQINTANIHICTLVNRPIKKQFKINNITMWEDYPNVTVFLRNKDAILGDCPYLSLCLPVRPPFQWAQLAAR